MAGFTADLNPKSNAMSLGDMMKMGLYSAETAIANRKEQIAAEQAKETPVVMQFMKNQEGYMTNGRIDLDKASILPVIAPLTGMDQYQKLVQLHKYRTEADDAEMGLDTKQRGIVASVGETLGYAGVQDPKQYIQAYQGLKQLYPNNVHIAKLADSYSNMISTIPPGKHVAEAAIKNSVDLLNPVDKSSMMAPKAEMANIGGADRAIVKQPSILGGQPTITPGGFGNKPLGDGVGGPTAPGATTTVGKMPKLIEYGNLKYNEDPNLFNLNSAQKVAYEAGDEMVKQAPLNIKAAKDIQQPVRKVEEYINSASGSKLYQTLQAGGKYAWGNSDLDALVKNIAQVQARNAEVMGLAKTDHMQDLNAKLSGSEKIDAKALAGVMQQVKADAVAAEKYNIGLQKFVEKHQDINGRILAKKFQSAWADNYDPRIFQRQNIENSQLPEREQDRRIREIDAGMTKDEFKDLENKAKILHRLEKGLYQ
jgi:hypothetical protein